MIEFTSKSIWVLSFICGKLLITDMCVFMLPFSSWKFFGVCVSQGICLFNVTGWRFWQNLLILFPYSLYSICGIASCSGVTSVIPGINSCFFFPDQSDWVSLNFIAFSQRTSFFNSLIWFIDFYQRTSFFDSLIWFIDFSFFFCCLFLCPWFLL